MILTITEEKTIDQKKKERHRQINKKYYNSHKEKIQEYREKNKERTKQYDKEYREKNKERITKRNKEYNQKNKEIIKQKQKEWQKNNKDKVREYKEKNKEKIAEYQKEWMKNHKDKVREYRNKYKERIKRYKQNNPYDVQSRNLYSGLKKRIKKGTPIDFNLFSIQYIKDWLIRQPYCKYCNKPLDIGYKNGKGVNDDSPSLDKFIPEKGYVKGNVILSCFRCNALKSDGTPDEIRTLAENITRVERELQ